LTSIEALREGEGIVVKLTRALALVWPMCRSSGGGNGGAAILRCGGRNRSQLGDLLTPRLSYLFMS
jgi:hypothetical protein